MIPLRIVHISDLHFVENPFETGGKWRSRSFRAKSHSVDHAGLLAETLAMMSGGIDLLVVTGDVSTDGSDGAFLAARSYLERESVDVGVDASPIP